MEKLIRDIIEESACRFAELTAVKWLKKKEIFEYLDDMKEKKVVKKSEENLKLDLKNEYVGDESTDNKSDKKLKYIGIAAVIVVIIGAGVLLKRCRKSQWYSTKVQHYSLCLPKEFLMKYILKNIKSFAKYSICFM